MKKQFRILAAALALCLSLLCCPAAFAAVDSSSCQTVPYAQATSQPLGQPITITGTPNYSAATETLLSGTFSSIGQNLTFCPSNSSE